MDAGSRPCMTACSQNEDIVIEQPVSDNDFESPDGRLIIQLGGIETRIGASVGVTRAPLDKLYDEAEGATTRLGIFALATNDATTSTAITDANRTAAWGELRNSAEQYTGSSNRLAQARRLRRKAGRFGE